MQEFGSRIVGPTPVGAGETALQGQFSNLAVPRSFAIPQFVLASIIGLKILKVCPEVFSIFD